MWSKAAPRITPTPTVVPQPPSAARAGAGGQHGDHGDQRRRERDDLHAQASGDARCRVRDRTHALSALHQRGIAAKPAGQSQKRERRRQHADRGARRPQPIGRPTRVAVRQPGPPRPTRPTRRCSPRTRAPAIRSPSRPGPSVSEARIKRQRRRRCDRSLREYHGQDRQHAGLDREQPLHRLGAEIAQPGQLVPALAVGVARDDPGRGQPGHRGGQRIINARGHHPARERRAADAQPPEHRHAHPVQRDHQVLRLRARPSLRRRSPA